ncbi:spermidine aminopropyltransferase, putative [Candida dubliniensis CD36]|uniref:Spermine synthase, putative n=1 Tax=Candida dubliniensis (strain CD36 / ATCC MYA-646 / CBS 7987 / NCPF 3949 / NRRL Y-17841) TaxID=573826 RepID=B9W9V7_CANDC|nr:spermidine aminopropyltransferase, putative [Candida dubliniensis CD36]CAX45593.1 spermidine aminopropyltransferase, putative [Candida dubliniensis CD36]
MSPSTQQVHESNQSNDSTELNNDIPLIELSSFKHDSITFHKQDSSYWFYEKSKQSFPGQSFGLQVEQILYHTQSPFQDILIFKSTNFGNVLVLNGIIQCTEKDEFAYQELITHLPIMSHPSPKKVLVIGGGDCGVIRELIKHVNDQTVREITMVEIDDMVIKLSTKFLPEMAKYHNHPKVNLIIGDGFEFLKNSKEKYDVIITDSSDPDDGPAEEFFQINYFKLLLNALNEKGIVIMQSSENIWLNLPYLKELKSKAASVFSNVKYCQCYMPSYTSGQLGLIIATMDTEKDLVNPLRKFDHEKELKLFKYYNQHIHTNSFVLPTWADDYLNN